ncbi:hypothetical protein KQR54_18335 [Mycobacterium gordonae]|nr:hypothetical protein [Mycobacterium gordonae]
MITQNRLDIDLSGRASLTRSILNRFFSGFNRRFEDALDAGARAGINEVLGEWEAEATRLAPKKTGKLRNSIAGRADRRKTNGALGGTIRVAAVKRGFDYAEYLHEVYPRKHGNRFRKPTTPGTIPRFIGEPFERNRVRWEQTMEDRLRAELRRRGFTR